VRAAGVFAKGRMRPTGHMFDMPALECTHREVTFVLWNLGMLNLTWKFNV